MSIIRRKLPLVERAAAVVFFAGMALAQPGSPAPGFASRTIQAIGYPVGGGATEVDLKNTGLLPQTRGKARIQSKAGVTAVEVDIQDLRSPTLLGAEFLTYVLWAVSPEGRAINLGAVMF